jgi:hypothetical protein
LFDAIDALAGDEHQTDPPIEQASDRIEHTGLGGSVEVRYGFINI